MSACVAFFLPTLILLGYWQLERGAQKREFQMAYIEQITRLPVPPGEGNLHTPFSRLRITGKFTPEVFLLDNQVRAGKVGYWVIQVFEDIGGLRFFTNRGYVSAPLTRKSLPKIVTPAAQVSLVGVVWPDMGLIPALQEDILAPGWPKRIQRKDLKKMAELTQTLPIEIRLEGGQPWVDHAAPDARVFSDVQHRGYAATWFGLAVALLFMYLVFGFRREH